MSETTQHGYLDDLLAIHRDPELKRYLEEASSGRLTELFEYFNSFLPEDGRTARVGLDLDGERTYVRMPEYTQPIHEDGGIAKYMVALDGARITTVGCLQLDKDAVTFSLIPRRADWCAYDDQPGDLYESGLYPLFTITKDGQLFGPVSDLAVIESFLSDDTRPAEV